MRWQTRLPFYYGWVVVAVAFLTMAIGVNARTAFSLFFPPILDEFGWERGVTALAFSVGFAVSLFFAPVVGFLMDRIGPQLVIPIGAVMVASGLMLCTIATTPLAFYVTMGILVVGGSIFLSYIGHSTFLPHWFVARRGLAVGIAFSGVGVGSMILFPWVQTFIDQGDWRAACIALALLTLLIVVPLNALLQRARPESLGLQPDGESTTSRADGQAATPANVVDSQWASVDWTLRRAMATSRFWWMSVGFFCALFGWYTVQVHQTRFFTDTGIDGQQAALALGLVGLFGIVGQIALGHFSDRVGREIGWTISVLGYVICYAGLILLESAPGLVPDQVMLYVIIASQGLLGYGIAPIYGAISAEVFQGRNFGTIFGTLSVSSGAGAAVGPWAVGYLYDVSGSYQSGFALALVLGFVSIACIWIAAPRKVRTVAGRTKV